MITELTAQGWIYIGFILAASGFFIGSAMDSVLGAEAFGPIGNMSVLIGGALAAGVGIEYTDFRTNDPTILAVVMVAGAFFMLGFLVVTKLGLSKLGA